MKKPIEIAGVTKHIGVPRKRSEDPQILMGQAKYVDDIKIPGTLEIAFLRSTHAHARIKNLKLEAAKQHPDCLHVFTSEELGAWTATFFPDTRGTLHPVRTPFLAQGKVRFVGEIVAAAVASSRYIAEDIVDLIKVDYETLPAYNDVEEAMKPDAALIHEELDSNIYYADSFSNGDVEQAFADADLVVSEKIATARTSAAPMETRGVMATWNWDNTLTVWSSTQMPYFLRTSIAVDLGIPEHTIRVVAPTVGGGFGQKAHLFPEEFILPWIAKEIQKPVKWIEDRREHLLSATHAKQCTNYVNIAFKKDGTMVGMKIKSIGDSGAYSQYPCSGLIESVVANNSAPGAFTVPNIQL